MNYKPCQKNINIHVISHYQIEYPHMSTMITPTSHKYIDIGLMVFSQLTSRKTAAALRGQELGHQWVNGASV